MMMFSYGEGESFSTYPAVAETNLRNFYEQLSTLVDFLVVDTSTARNNIDAFFLKQTMDICITTADAKGFAYREFYKPQGMQLLLRTSRYNALSDVMGTFSKPVPVLPFSKTLTAVYNGMDIRDITPPKQYRKIIESVVDSYAGAL